MKILELALGALLVAATWLSVLVSLVVPRGLKSLYTRTMIRAVRWPFQYMADRCKAYETKDRVLAWAAPLAILVTLISWLLLFLVGYGLLLAGANAGLGLDAAMREAGSSLLTLGFASTDRSRLTFLDFCAAATGPVTIGLQVGYLPALYTAYSRRETEVTLLQARAGVPAWGPEILFRHVQVAGLLSSLPDLYRGWERWAAEISESHTSYPVLIHFRSPQPYRNWLIALLAVMDAGAMELALNPSNAVSGTIRVGLRGGFTCLREIARSEGIPYNPDPDPDDDIQLTYDEFVQGVDMLRYAGYAIERKPEDAWPHFRGWRVNYESTAYELAYLIDAVPAPWSGPRRTPGQTVKVRSPRDRKPTRGLQPKEQASGGALAAQDTSS